MMDVSIILVNYKTKELTINCIHSIFEKTRDVNFEIFVVDNNSQDGSIEVIEKEFSNINIIKNSINSGFGAANNLAIKQARGKYILCLNTDTLLMNNAIKIMYDFMEDKENNNVGACGGFIYDMNNKPAHCAGRFPTLNEIVWKIGLRNIFRKRYGKYKKILFSNEEEFLNNIDYIIGADIFFRKSVLDAVGLFDEDFFMYFEETDLCKRIKDRGYDIKFVKNAQIKHIEGSSSPKNIEKLKMIKESELLYFRKHHPQKVLFVKYIYLLLYFIDGFILDSYESRELLKYLLFL